MKKLKMPLKLSIKVIKKMNFSLPPSFLSTIYKSFARPNLDNGGVNFDKPNNSSLSDKNENVQCNAMLSVTSAIRGTSKEKLYDKLRLEPLRNRSRLRRMSYLYKIISTIEL